MTLDTLMMNGSEDRVWLAINPVQCMQNPWEKEWRESNPDEGYPSTNSTAIAEIMRSYYEEQGFTIFDIKIVKLQTLDYVPADRNHTCEGCGCSLGHTVLVKVLKSDAPAMLGMDFRSL